MIMLKDLLRIHSVPIRNMNGGENECCLKRIGKKKRNGKKKRKTGKKRSGRIHC
jgi:hypothetical protein